MPSKSKGRKVKEEKTITLMRDSFALFDAGSNDKTVYGSIEHNDKKGNSLLSIDRYGLTKIKNTVHPLISMRLKNALSYMLNIILHNKGELEMADDKNGKNFSVGPCPKEIFDNCYKNIIHYDRDGNELLRIDDKGGVKLKGMPYTNISIELKNALDAMLLDIGIYLRDGR